jgi:hypothetical protein
MNEGKPSNADVRQKDRRIMRRSTWLTLALIITLSAVTYYIASSSISPLSRFQSPPPASVPPLALHAYQQMLDGSTKEISQVPDSGSHIVFTLSTVKPLHTALGLSVDDHEPVVVFEGAKIAPGPTRILEKEDELFIYDVKPSDHQLKFCLFGADDAAHLHQTLTELPQAWKTSAPPTCVVLASAH